MGVIAGRSVTQNANIVAGQDILVRALGGDVTMSATTSSTVGAGRSVIVDASGDIRLGLLDATATGRVALNAGSDIIDGNIGEAIDTNIIAAQLRMVAGDFIGNRDLGQVDANRNAIDTRVGTVAAFADDGIYIQEEALGGELIIGSVAATTITFDSIEVKFDSSQINVPATLTLDARDGLSTRNDGVLENGFIKVRVDDGTLRVNSSVASDAGGDMLLRAYGTGSDVLVNASVTSGFGNLTIHADDDVTTAANVNTSGNIFMQALDNQVDIRE